MELSRARNILLCLRYGIGDVVMELPVLDALRRAVPAARITGLAAAPAQELLEGDDRIDEVVSIDRWGLTHRWDRGDTAMRQEIGAWLDASGFDLLLDVFHSASGVAEAVWQRRIPSMETDQGAEEWALAAGADGVAAIKASVAAGWGLEVPREAHPRLALRGADLRFAELFLRHHGLEREAPVGISPVASQQLKRWPADRLAAVADGLAAETGRPVLLFCGPQAQAGHTVLQSMRCPGEVVLVGSLHLKRVAALLARCAVFVCNDTGLMHMASAVGTPTVAVFGPTAPNIYLPPAAHAAGVGGVGIACPHRNTLSNRPPECWSSDRCLIAEQSCIDRAGTHDVLGAARAVLRTADVPTVYRGGTTGG